MIKRKLASCYLHFKTRKMAIRTCTLPLDQPPISTPRNDHKTLCLSLANDLLLRGLLSSARQIIRRIIVNSSTFHDTISAFEFAVTRGVELDVGCCGALIRRFMDFGRFELAHAFYCEHIVARGIEPDSGIINSMLICFVKLGKLEDAMILFDEIIGEDCVPCKAACNAILREFFARERFLEAFRYLVRISDTNAQLGMWCYNALIDGLCCTGYVGEAVKVLDIMCERTGLPPTLHLFKSLFYGFCKKGWVVEAESVFSEMEAHGFFVDKVMYTALMNAYCNDKKVKMAMRVYFRMLKTGCEPDNYAYNTLIHGFVKMGLFDKGWMLCNQMTQLGTMPNVVTYHVMISNYCNAGKVDCATMLLNNMISCNLAPSVHSYTALIVSLYKKNQFMEVDELYKSMLRRGVSPDHILFFVLMKNNPKGLELQLSRMILQAIAKNGCGLDPSALSASAHMIPSMDLEEEIEILLREISKKDLSLANLAFGIYIGALCEAGKTNAALACLMKMVNLGCCPLLFTFNSLIKRLLQDGLFEDVKSLVNTMQDLGMVPDKNTYLIMVKEYCERRDLVSAIDILDQMEKRGQNPSVAVYDCIIRCLSREKRISEAENLFQRMLCADVDPDENVITTMIDGYCRNGRFLEAKELFERMISNAIQPSSYSYTTLISWLVKGNMTSKGCLYLDKMLRDCFLANIVLYTSLVSYFLRRGEFEFAFRLVDLVDRDQIECDLVFYVALLSGVCRNIANSKKRWSKVDGESKREGEMLLHLLHQSSLPMEKVLKVTANSPEEIKGLALKLMQRIKGVEFMPNLYLYNSIISGLCWADRTQDAYDQYALMQKEGICPNEVTFTILIGTHCRAGQIDHAIVLFNNMRADGFSPDKVTYTTLLKGLCKAGREVDALSLLYMVHKRGFFPSKASYRTLLHCLCASYSSIRAFKVFKEMLAYNYVPSPYSCNWLLCILCMGNRIHEAHMVLDMMVVRGKSPNELAKRLLEEPPLSKENPNSHFEQRKPKCWKKPPEEDALILYGW